jgi:ABC-type lipoprotein release transport system permease subunit
MGYIMKKEDDSPVDRFIEKLDGVMNDFDNFRDRLFSRVDITRNIIRIILFLVFASIGIILWCLFY